MAQASVTVSRSRRGQRRLRRRLVFGVACGLGASWLACGSATDAGLESPGGRASLAGAAGAAGASGSSTDCPVVLEPSAGSSGPTTAWGRNPETGTCCPYADLVYLPEPFPFFESLEACENSCRCAELSGTGQEPEEPWVVERISLECFCSEVVCPESLAAVVAERCGAGQTLHRSRGCGLEMVERVTELGVVASWVFDAAAGALVGASEGSDTPRLPCRAYSTQAGAALDCPQAERCRLCGELELELGETTPRCAG